MLTKVWPAPAPFPQSFFLLFSQNENKEKLVNWQSDNLLLVPIVPTIFLVQSMALPCVVYNHNHDTNHLSSSQPGQPGNQSYTVCRYGKTYSASAWKTLNQEKFEGKKCVLSDKTFPYFDQKVDIFKEKRNIEFNCNPKVMFKNHFTLTAQ